MADTRIPATHWVARLGILFVLAVLVFAFSFSGALTGALGWATDCGGRIAVNLWAPLLGSEERAAVKPVSGCLGDETAAPTG